MEQVLKNADISILSNFQSAKGPICLGLNLRLHKYIGTHFNGMVLHFWNIEYVGNAVDIMLQPGWKALASI